ncbi:GTPase HflX [Pallidibacillus thermolactis]|uniref:GTPase HflX n=1 Tax=Pallidibacillus thermolactis TaxID=251051 RepID=UPI0021DAD2AB|nr:GTPase HflX [Pallidibacillus thermolactis]MCU9600805.1 GTPase HflX [Pallidibacillus thermolactis subsp. kokeshiiformis]
MMEVRKKAVVVGVHINSNDDEFTESMQELHELAYACNYDVVSELTQKLDKVNKAHYIGRGKLEELKTLIDEVQAEIVIFNDELSPSQIQVLEDEAEAKVIDRTMLILDIFASRAKTKEAKLQVEIAQLKYMLPRLVGQGVSMGRQGGGAGLKNRGAGETKLELDRRKIETKIAELSKELNQLVKQRETQRKKRKKNQFPVVSLVGYTNAGKSTIMNAMIDKYNPYSKKKVFERDMLFATLDTTVRQISLPDNKQFLLADTVGFVSKLPHHLVKAFRSTLEEVREADLLIHVVDIANPNYEKIIEVTNETLTEIGVTDIPVIFAYNKADLARISYPKIEDNRIYLSAKQNKGIDELAKLICQSIFTDYIQCEMLIPYHLGHIVSYFNEVAHIKDTTYEENGTKIIMECKQKDLEKYKEFVIKIGENEI